jgi:hypothetical protein
VRVIWRLGLNHFLKCSSSTDRARTKQISKSPDSVEDSGSLRAFRDMPYPPALSQ